MKRFLKIVIFLLIGGFLVDSLSHYYLERSRFIKFHGKWYVPAYVLEKSKKPRRSDYIIIGNSVCNQLFPMQRHDASLASNAGVTVIGNFLLLKNAFKRNRIKNVFYFIFPHDLNRSLDHKYTYRQFLLPFLTHKSYASMEPRLQTVLKASPLSFLAMVPYFKVTNMVSDIKVRDINRNQSINPIFIAYLRQMNALCAGNGAELKIIAMPVPNRFETHYDTLLRELKTKIQHANLMDIFHPGFFEDIIFIEPDKLKDDVHLKKQYVDGHRLKYKEIIDEYRKTGGGAVADTLKR